MSAQCCLQIGGEKPFVFIYIKDGNYMCKNEHQVSAKHKNYLADGWKHTATIDAALWLNNYLNAGESGRFDLVEEISK